MAISHRAFEKETNWGLNWNRYNENGFESIVMTQVHLHWHLSVAQLDFDFDLDMVRIHRRSFVDVAFVVVEVVVVDTVVVDYFVVVVALDWIHFHRCRLRRLVPVTP